MRERQRTDNDDLAAGRFELAIRDQGTRANAGAVDDEVELAIDVYQPVKRLDRGKLIRLRG